MLDNLTQRFARVVKQLRGEARLTESNVADALREVRMALLEADVALPVVKDFIARVKEKALGEEVVGSLTPGQALVGVVHRELTAVMGGENAGLDLAVAPPAVILMAGLQGSGKTTTAGKLAKLLKEEMRKKPLVVSADVYRPAAIEQLRTLAAQVSVDFFPSAVGEKPIDIARAAVAHARTHYNDVLIVDTAGRLAIDEAMMKEIAELHAALAPAETLFVVDSMQGQDAVNVAKAFGEALPLTGVVLTKLDGDARGGAALSVRSVTGKPIKFAGVGEKLDGLEPFHPERMAARILGMGDIVSLVEEARKGIDQGEAREARREVQEGQGLRPRGLQGPDPADEEDGRSSVARRQAARRRSRRRRRARRSSPTAARCARIEGIINSMTPAERAKPEIIKASRKRRIAAGAGVPVQEVNRLLNQFGEMQKMMKTMQKGGLAKMMRAMKGVFPGAR